MREWSYSSIDGDEWSASYSSRFTLWYSSDRRLGGPKNQSGCCKEEKYLFLLVAQPVA
jgi:hypothetical protein